MSGYLMREIFGDDIDTGQTQEFLSLKKKTCSAILAYSSGRNDSFSSGPSRKIRV